MSNSIKLYDCGKKRLIKSAEEIYSLGVSKSLIDGSIIDREGNKQHHLTDHSGKPSCFGEMYWVLKYKENEVPTSSICNCSYKERCQNITRDIADAN